ncbi:MAG: hypothetical protein E3J81_03540 [Dehalococcoidia bacterium]|nr:MAG: hypothetical protein E3J81_03540 [Dehalococcoidia bacterium]
MGCARQGFDLFNKYGRRAFFHPGVFGDRWGRQFVLQDTFGRYVCKLLGHSKKTYEVEDYEEDYICVVCKRCYRVIGRRPRPQEIYTELPSMLEEPYGIAKLPDGEKDETEER